MVSSSFDTLNVIYRSHMLILLVCLPQIYVHSSPYASLIIRNALKYNNDGNFLQKSSAEKTKIAAIFYFYATWVCKMQFHWPGINQLAVIFVPPCALVYNVMPFCVDANMTTSEVVHHLLINYPLFLTRDGCSMSATRCQHLMVSGQDHDVNSYLRSLLDARLFKSSHSIMI